MQVANDKLKELDANVKTVVEGKTLWQTVGVARASPAAECGVGWGAKRASSLAAVQPRRSAAQSGASSSGRRVCSKPLAA